MDEMLKLLAWLLDDKKNDRNELAFEFFIHNQLAPLLSCSSLFSQT